MCVTCLVHLHHSVTTIILPVEGNVHAMMHKPKYTKVGVVTTAQVMHSLGEDRFANIKLLKSEELPVKD